MLKPTTSVRVHHPQCRLKNGWRCAVLVLPIAAPMQMDQNQGGFSDEGGQMRPQEGVSSMSWDQLPSAERHLRSLDSQPAVFSSRRMK